MPDTIIEGSISNLHLTQDEMQFVLKAAMDKLDYLQKVDVLGEKLEKPLQSKLYRFIGRNYRIHLKN